MSKIHHPVTMLNVLFLIGLYMSSFSVDTFANGKSSSPHSLGNQIIKEERDIQNIEKQRPVKLDIWRTETNCVANKNSGDCETSIPAISKIAILSHGAMGSAIDYSWLAYPLAANGWTVIGMNHFGESWRYGQANIDPSTVTRFWQRTEDVSFVLDSMAEILPKHSIANDAEIVIIGHSSGGQTAAALAGVTMSMQQMIDYCSSDKSSNDLGCTYGKPEGEQTHESSFTMQSGGYDKRISGVIMLDPALGPAATISSLGQVTRPTLVIGSLNNDFLPFEHHAKYYAAHIPSAQLMTLDNDEGHFIYLNECEHQHKAKGVSLCQDRAGVDRKQAHNRMIGRIFGFLN